MLEIKQEDQSARLGLDSRSEAGIVFLGRYLAAPALRFQVAQLVELFMTVFLAVLAHRAVVEHDLGNRLHLNAATEDEIRLLGRRKSFLDVVGKEFPSFAFGVHDGLVLNDINQGFIEKQGFVGPANETSLVPVFRDVFAKTFDLADVFFDAENRVIDAVAHVKEVGHAEFVGQGDENVTAALLLTVRDARGYDVRAI